MVFIGYFADVPSFQRMPPDQAELKLIVRHSGQLLGECHAPDAAQQAKLPRNMRAPMVCPRERSPVQVKLSLNSELIFEEKIKATGFHEDGISAAYRRFQVPAGPMRVQVTVNDKSGDTQATYEYDEQLSLLPAESVALEFSGGFVLHQEDSKHVGD
jgi:hypothetical protein